MMSDDVELSIVILLIRNIKPCTIEYGSQYK